jgi:hypothetical protein
MPKHSKGVRLGLGEPIQGLLADFCAAHYNASERDVIRTALEVFISQRLEAEPEMRKRFDDARKKRLGLGETVVKLVTTDDLT